MTRHTLPLALVAALMALVILSLPGCGSTSTAFRVLNNTHDEVDCTYKRGGTDADGNVREKTDYEWQCSFKGSLPVEDGGAIDVQPSLATF